MGLFGTDGVRGPAGQGPLSPMSALRIGLAFGASAPPGPIAVARDTRRSGDALVAAVTAGLLSTGRDVLDLGVLPTPALSWWLAGRAGGGVMVTASHNPWHDNGFKLFAPDGRKVDDAVQEATEAAWAALHDAATDAFGARQDVHLDARGAYLESLAGAEVLGGRKVVVDHAAGAAWQVAGPALRARGAVVVAAAPVPDGRNINEGVGAVHPETCARQVVATGAWAGLCLDGDGDRIVLVDERGTIHDGDAILGALALARPGTKAVVGTVTSGMGLQAFLRARGITLHRSDVGDRHVAQRMEETGAPLGGESSGHILTPDLCPTGDGLRVGLDVLALAAPGALSDLLGAVPRFPTAHRKVLASRKPPLSTLPALLDALGQADEALGPIGARQLVRWSGTEPVLRILVEGPEAALVDAWADRIAAAARAALEER